MKNISFMKLIARSIGKHFKYRISFNNAHGSYLISKL